MSTEASQVDANSDVKTLLVSGFQSRKLRYGENPHQEAAVYSVPDGGINLAGTVPLQGKELSYNNLLDSEGAIFALRCLSEGSDDAAVVIIKHTTPCGAGREPDIFQAWLKALIADPVSAFGGIVACSHEVDKATATEMIKMFLEVVIAPSFSDEAKEVLAKKKNLRLLEIDNLMTAKLPTQQIRSIMGGSIIQSHDAPPTNIREAKVVTERAPTDEEWVQLDIAFKLCTAMKSNAISLVKDGALVGFGSGQTSRVDAVKLAAAQASGKEGMALGSDAFFPFADGLEAATGVTCVAQPGGSKRDQEVIDAANKLGMAMVFTGTRHFRH